MKDYEALTKKINEIESYGNGNLDYEQPLLFFQSVEHDITFPVRMDRTTVLSSTAIDKRQVKRLEREQY